MCFVLGNFGLRWCGWEKVYVGVGEGGGGGRVWRGAGW